MREDVRQYEVIAKDTFLSVTLSDSSFLSVPRNSLTFISALNGALGPKATAILNRDYTMSLKTMNDVMIKNRNPSYL